MIFTPDFLQVMHRRLFLLLLYILWFPCFLSAQLTETFTDADFVKNPHWTGDTTKYMVNNSLQLQLNGAVVADTAYLSTSNKRIDNTEWNFWLKLGFSPSTSNYVKIYLVSDKANLKGMLNGYYIRIGESGSLDGIDLYRQSGKTSSKIIDGLNGRAAKANTALRIKVTRDKEGNWNEYSDTTGGYNYRYEGTAYDNTFTSTSSFGFSCRYTKSSKTKFFMDEVFIKPSVPDTLPPRLDSLIVRDEKHLDLYFDEPLKSVTATKLSNYVLDHKAGLISQVLADSNDNSMVHLSLYASLLNGSDHVLNFFNISDTVGNIGKQPDSVKFYYEAPYTPVYGDVVINEILADPTPPVGLPNAEFVELYNTTDQFISLYHWKLSDGSTIGLFPRCKLKPHEHLIICAQSDTLSFSAFGKTVGLSAFPALNNEGDALVLSSNMGANMDVVQYESAWYSDPAKKGGGWSLERKNPTETFCSTFKNWTASVASAGGTPGKQNSVFTTASDTAGIYIVGVTIKSPTTIRVNFSSGIDSSNTTLSMFSLTAPLQNPVKMKFSANHLACTLTFTDSLKDGEIYMLTTKDLQNCKGLKSSSSYIFSQGKAPRKGDLIINELMADPAPPQALPEFEYVELYNASTSSLELAGVTLSDGTSTAKLDSNILLPGAYLIVSSTSAAQNLSYYGRTLGLASFPSLNNESDTLTLRTKDSVELEMIAYNTGWYHNSNKTEGGFSLEKIDPLYACSGALNWVASSDKSGGTPGRKNSVFGTVNDTSLFRALSLTVLDSVTLRVSCNHLVDTLSVKDKNCYGVQPAIPVVSAVADHNDILIKLEHPPARFVIYQLSVQSLRDCAGNVIQTCNLPFGISEQAEKGDILINELLFNPYPYGFDFVEIYNNSNKIIDCKDLFLANESFFKDSAIYWLSKERQMLFPGQFKVFTESPSGICETYNCKAISSVIACDLPTYPDNKGSVLLMNKEYKLIDRFDYKESMQFPLLSSKEGVALERVSYNRPTADSGNWHSAAEQAGFATPGYQNSQYESSSGDKDEISLINEVFSPDNDGYKDELIINYNFTNAAQLATIKVYNDKGIEIKTLCNSEYIAATGALSWNGIMNNGSKAPIGPYVIFVQTTDPGGDIHMYKKICVVGGKI